MYVDVSTKRYKDRKYYSVRVMEAKYIGKKRVNKIVKPIGNTSKISEVEELKKKAWEFILETQKDVKISLAEIRKIRQRSPIGLTKAIERILSNLGLLRQIKKMIDGDYEEFMEEIVYRFYFVTSERKLYLATEKPKDRYYRLLDNIFLLKQELEDLFYRGLVRKGKITKYEIKIDTTSTYFEGNNVSFAMFGYSRDHRSDRKQIIVLLVLVDDYPLFSYVFEGNKKDTDIFLQAVDELRKRVKCERFTIFCDRGFFKPEHLDFLEECGISYVMAVPRRIGDWPNFHDNKSTEFFVEGRRAILYENTELRESLLEELDETLGEIKEDLKILTPSEIKRKYKFALKFVDLERKQIKEKVVEKERKVLGRWIVLTNIKDKTAEEIVKDYKSLQELERDFRTLKNELRIRPIGHRKGKRVIAHIFLCVLTLLVKHLLEEELGKDGIHEVMEIFSYEILTDRGPVIWSEKLAF